MNKIILRSGDIEYESTYRNFGFASSLLFAYSIVQGLAVAVLLYKMQKESVKVYPIYIAMIILLIVSILFNARIGFTPIFIMVIYLLIIKRSYKIIIAAIVLLPLLSYFLFNSSLSYLFGENLDWSLRFFSETQQLLSSKGNGGSTYDVLLNDMIFLPENISGLIFGVGYDIMFNSNHHSDVGYIRQIFFGGIIYLSILFYLIICMLKRLRKIDNVKWISFLFIFTLLICEVKGIFISNNSAFRVLILFYVNAVYFNAIMKRKRKLIQDAR